jgi:hypothetical protein
MTITLAHLRRQVCTADALMPGGLPVDCVGPFSAESRRYEHP